MDHTLFTRWILSAYFILLAIIIDLFTFNNINFLFISIAMIGLVILTSLHHRDLPLTPSYSLAIIFLCMLVSSFAHAETIRWTSILYSAFFIVTFTFYSGFFKSFVDKAQFRWMLRIVFYLYLIGLIAGQLHVYLNLFSAVSGIIGFMRGSFGTILEKGGMRFYSFSSEPSYASFIAISVYYVFVKLDTSRLGLFKGENLVMLVLLAYMVFMFRSAYGVLLFGIMVVDYVGVTRNMILLMLLSALALTFIVISDVEVRVLNRIVNVMERIDLSDPRSLVNIDFTAYYRIAPILQYVETIDLLDFDFLIGHGAGASRYFVVPDIYSAYLGGEFLGGFLPAFFYDFGLLGGVLVLLFLSRGTHQVISFQTATMALMLLNANFNTQLFWLIFICFYMLEFYRKEDYVTAQSQLDRKLNMA